MSLMKERFEGGMQIQANSFKGVMSTISGVWKSGLAQMAGVSDEGLVVKGSFFDVIKDKAVQISENLQGLQASGKFEELQKSFGKFATDISNGIDIALPKLMNLGNYMLTHGPQIMNIARFIGMSFLTWKAINFVSNAVTTISNLAGMLRLARTQYLPLLFAKMQDMALTAGIIGLYTWDAVCKGASAIKTFLLAGAQGALNVAVAIGTGVMGAFGAVMAFLTSPIGLVIIGVTLLVAGLIYLWNTSETVRTSVTNFFSTLKQWGVDACNAVINALNSLIDLINKIPLINIPKIPNVGGDSKGGKSSKGMKKYAKGGIATRPSICGEAGPEAVIPLKKNNPRSIQLLEQTSRILGVNQGVSREPLGTLKPRNISLKNKRSTSSNGDGNYYTYSPTIYAGGNDKQQIKEMILSSFEDFKDFIDNMNEDGEMVNIDETIFNI